MPSRQAGCPPTPAPRSSEMHLHWKCLLQGGPETELSPGRVRGTALGGVGDGGCFRDYLCLCPYKWLTLGESFCSCLLPTWLSTPEGFRLVDPSTPLSGKSRTRQEVLKPQVRSCSNPPRSRGQQTRGLWPVGRLVPILSRHLLILKLHDGHV